MPDHRHGDLEKMKRVLLLMSGLITGAVPAAADEEPVPLYPTVRVETSLGSFTLMLDGSRAPLTVANFVRYVRDSHFDGTIFHRVVADFLIEGGGFTPVYEERETRGPIRNEAGNGLRNQRGTIAMARTGDPHSARAQFYINVTDNRALDPNSARWGYTVFGQVTAGMEVVERIAAVPTGPGGPFSENVPQSGVIIEKVTLFSGPGG